MPRTLTVPVLLSAALVFLSCQSDKGKQPVAAAKTGLPTHCDIDGIEESGEIIAVTMYGRATYFEYHGKKTGTAYEMLCDFAERCGFGVRVETVADTTRMIKMLSSGEADIALTPLSVRQARGKGLVVCGMKSGKGDAEAGWAVRKNQPELARELDAWYKPDMLKTISDNDRTHRTTPYIKRHVRAPYVSRSKGIISNYDNEFKHGSRHVGWDWRLIAAQCYQESGFDPDAVSWAGAKGLMQIMPATAKELNLDDVCNPKDNIDAGCRYLRMLQGKFGDIRNRVDRIRFTLAAYNGGFNHIRDAMSLARKYGKNPTLYDNVSYYIRNLDKPKYYNDPVVEYGFMVGSETYNYVESIMARWAKYRGGKAVATITDGGGASPMPRKSRRNRFTRNGSEIINLRDSL